MMVSSRLARIGSTLGQQCGRPTLPTATKARFHASRVVADDAKLLKVHQGRLMGELHESCQWGTGKRWGNANTDTGMARLALSDSDKQVRDWFGRTASSLGCKVTVDQMGNMFAIRPGTDHNLPPIYIGSHLDTQPTGGRYDGILGVLAGLEALRVLQDHGVHTAHPIGVVNWTNEEGARFPITMLSSGVWAEAISLERAHACHEVGNEGVTIKSELERIGYLGSKPSSYKHMPMAAHFELHIEQGPILEKSQQKIGVVTRVQAYKWFTVEVTGRAAHTGTTPLESRSDAMLTAARMITHSNSVAAEFGALVSTGMLTLQAGSTNVIPENVRFTLDVRAASDSVVADVEQRLKRDFDLLRKGQNVAGLPTSTQKGLPLDISWRTDSDSPAVHFHHDCIQAIRESADSVLGNSSLHRDMMSGAGHDSVYTSRHCPTAMVFVPSKNGISHHPEEWTSAEDCALGATVLVQAVVRYDRMATARTPQESV